MMSILGCLRDYIEKLNFLPAGGILGHNIFIRHYQNGMWCGISNSETV